MESLIFPQFRKTLSVALFTELQDPGSILKRILDASNLEGVEGDQEREAVNYAFIDAKLITSIQHLHAAVVQSLLAKHHDKLRTKTIHSEIIWSLNPTNNITEGLRRFGISVNTTNLLLVQIHQKPVSMYDEIEKSMKNLVKGSIMPLDRLSACAEWSAIRKVYRLNEDLGVKTISNEAELRRRIDEIVISTVATKSVQA